MRFARGFTANNAMLWGARGTGKSSLVQAAHAAANADLPGSLALIEIHREDIRTLPDLLGLLRAQPRRCLVFCDDLSFEREDADYKALKSVLDGGIEGRPENVLFYATSNRRHLMSRDMIENESRGAIHGQESVEEKVSLSDRFGLWIGFHNCDQDTFFAMIEGYAATFALPIGEEELRRAADAAERVLDLVGEVADELPVGLLLLDELRLARDADLLVELAQLDRLGNRQLNLQPTHITAPIHQPSAIRASSQD
jgi:predicted AAA+ superfamily ATPase